MSNTLIDIYNEIENRLKLIKSANGYTNTVRRVERTRSKEFEDGDIPAITFYPLDIDTERDAYGIEKHALPILIYGYKKVDPKDSLADSIAHFMADIHTALHRAPEDPLTTDDCSADLGEMVEAFMLSSTSFSISNNEAQNPWCGVIMKYTTTFQTATGDLFAFA